MHSLTNLSKGQCTYPFFSHKTSIWLLGGWVGKINLSWHFVWQSGFKENIGLQMKKYNKQI